LPELGVVRRTWWILCGPTLSIALAIASVYSLWGAYSRNHSYLPPDAIGINLALLASLPLAFRRRDPVVICLLVSGAVMALTWRQYVPSVWLFTPAIAMGAVVARRRLLWPPCVLALVAGLGAYVSAALSIRARRGDQVVLQPVEADGWLVLAPYVVILLLVISGSAYRIWSRWWIGHQRADSTAEARLQLRLSDEWGWAWRTPAEWARTHRAPAATGAAALLAGQVVVALTLSPSSATVEDVAAWLDRPADQTGTPSLVATSSGAVVVAGSVTTHDPVDDPSSGYAVSQYGPSGELEWTTQLTSGDHDPYPEAAPVAVGPDGVIAVLTWPAEGSTQATALHLLSRSGGLIWEQEIRGAAPNETHLVVTSQTGVAIVRSSPGNPAVSVELLSDSGEPAWRNETPGQLFADPVAGPDGSVYLLLPSLAFTGDLRTGELPVLVRLDATGEETVMTEPGDIDARAHHALSIGTDGTVAVTGAEVSALTENGTPTRTTLTVFDPDGDRQWDVERSGPSLAFLDVAIADGQVTVAGTSMDSLFGRIPVGSTFPLASQWQFDGDGVQIGDSQQYQIPDVAPQRSPRPEGAVAYAFREQTGAPASTRTAIALVDAG
jgi:hypothetical protein